jgi:hypothetical protein
MGDFARVGTQRMFLELSPCKESFGLKNGELPSHCAISLAVVIEKESPTVYEQKEMCIRQELRQ